MILIEYHKSEVFRLWTYDIVKLIISKDRFELNFYFQFKIVIKISFKISI